MNIEARGRFTAVVDEDGYACTVFTDGEEALAYAAGMFRLKLMDLGYASLENREEVVRDENSPERGGNGHESRN